MLKKTNKLHASMTKRQEQKISIDSPLVGFEDLKHPKSFNEKLNGGKCFRIPMDDLLKFTTL